VAVCRSALGATNPASAAPGTIRGDLALSMPDNLAHASDAPETAHREIALWFEGDELV
jgi:nucleoside-diphosphate kinase